MRTDCSHREHDCTHQDRETGVESTFHLNRGVEPSGISLLKAGVPHFGDHSTRNAIVLLALGNDGFAEPLRDFRAAFRLSWYAQMHRAKGPQ